MSGTAELNRGNFSKGRMINIYQLHCFNLILTPFVFLFEG